MVKDNLYQSFEIVLREPLDACPRSEHSYSFWWKPPEPYFLKNTGMSTLLILGILRLKPFRLL